METSAAYLEHLTDADLAILTEGAGLSALAHADAAARLRTQPELVLRSLSASATFERTFGEHDRDGLLVHASPFLVFAVAVHRAVEELGRAPFVEERVGPRLRVPVFDTGTLREFTADPTRRLFVVEHLASYTRVTSGPVWVRRGTRWRRQRFSELDPHRLAAFVAAVPEEEQAGVYRRLGDLALFLAGVFPDHTAARRVHPIELERLLRSVSPAGVRATARDDAARLVAERGAAGLLERLGPRWYGMAAARTPLPGLAGLLDDLASRFDQARRFLNLLTDRYLFPFRSRWFPSP